MQKSIDENDRGHDEFDEFGEDDFGGFVVAEDASQVGGAHHVAPVQEYGNDRSPSLSSSSNEGNSFSEEVLIVDTVPLPFLPGRPAATPNSDTLHEEVHQGVALPLFMAPPVPSTVVRQPEIVLEPKNSDSIPSTGTGARGSLTEQVDETFRGVEVTPYVLMQPLVSQAVVDPCLWKELHQRSKCVKPLSISFPLTCGALSSFLSSSTSEPQRQEHSNSLLNDLIRLEYLEPQMGTKRISTMSDIVPAVLEYLQFTVDDASLT